MRDKSKVKSVATIMLLLLSAMAGMMFVGNIFVKNARAAGGPVESFSILTPTDNDAYPVGYGINVTWSNPTGSNDTGFNLTISGPQSDSDDDNTDYYYMWTPTKPGTYTISVYGYNDTEYNLTYATNDNITVKIGTPGYNMWQGGNYDITGGYGSVDNSTILTTATSNLVYSSSYKNIAVDSSKSWEDSKYYLWKPKYNGTADFASSYYDLNWIRAGSGGDDDEGAFTEIDPNTSDYSFDGVLLDRAGLWLIATGTADNFDLSTYSNFNSTVAGWFWVNGSTDYTVTPDVTSFSYNASGTLSLTLKDESDEAIGGIVDIRRDDNGSSILGRNSYTGGNGIKSYYKNSSYFWSVGNYSAYGYLDVDTWTHSSDDYINYYGEENMADSSNKFYNSTYGANTDLTDADAWLDNAAKYNWSFCGPWDPPEYYADPQSIEVETGTPYTSVQNDSQYWGFDGEVNITIKETSSKVGTFTSGTTTVKVYNDDGEEITNNVTIDNTNIADGYIHINSSMWGKDTSVYGENGTWYAYIYVDTNSDRGNNNKTWTEEWNTSVEWTVESPPNAQFEWVDDDGAFSYGDSDNTPYDGIIPRIPQNDSVPIDIQFKIYGSTASTYYGSSSETKAMENITISGNALFTGSLDKIPGVGYSAGIWTVPIIPTMGSGGGTITITVNAYNTTVEETLIIGKDNYDENGSVVTVSPNTFMIDQQDQTLTVTVEDAGSGNSLNAYSDLYIYYLDDTDGSIKGTAAKSVTSGSRTTITFNITAQTTYQTSKAGFTSILAPRNLTLYVDGPGNRYGYALIEMTAVNDLQPAISRTTFMAGKTYDDLEINCTIVGNSSETPSEDDKADFYIKIYDEDGTDVTDTLFNGISASDLTNDANYKFGDGTDDDFDNVYATEPGTYTLYAYNNTHNSEDYNATFEVKAVDITCDKDPFIWSADDNITATFTVTFEGEPINGTLRVDNISDVEGSDYNMTWANTSFTPSGTTGSDAASNDSLALDVVDGVATINDLTASYLATGETSQTHTFYFQPENTEGTCAYAEAGSMTTRVPTITVSPEKIPLGEAGGSKVTVTTYGRSSTKVGSVYVGLDGQGVSVSGNTSNSAASKGEVEFTIIPTSTGNISIDVGASGRTVDDTVLQVVSQQLSISVSPNTVDEGSVFTVTVTDGTDPVSGATVIVVGLDQDTTDSNGEVEFIAPSVSSTRSYDIRATHPQYTPDPDQPIKVYIENVYSYMISADDEVEAGAQFDVAVAKDTGDPVIGATITFNGNTYKTKAGGVATITAPTTTGDYTIEASFSGKNATPVTITVTAAANETDTPDEPDDKDEKEEPGFELLTLVAAIGVAFILLKRRRKYNK